MEKLFSVSSKRYSETHDFFVYYPASLDNPRNNAVMFINAVNTERVNCLLGVENSIVFFPDGLSIPESVRKKNLMIPCADPRLSYCLFFKENGISNDPQKEKMTVVDGAFISDRAKIGKDVTIMPMAYIGGQVCIGDNVYIGTGTKIVGRVVIGNNVVIRENTVIGADGLSTDRCADGTAATMPQFGGVIIGDDVKIGASTVIARGAIDNTVIGRGSKIDNCSFISHNVKIGEDTFIVGETIMFGGSSAGNQAFISGNSTVRNKVSIGDRATVGMGSVVTKNVDAGSTVFGSPAHKK